MTFTVVLVAAPKIQSMARRGNENLNVFFRGYSDIVASRL